MVCLSPSNLLQYRLMFTVADCCSLSTVEFRYQRRNWASIFRPSGQSGLFWTRGVEMMSLHAHPFGERIEVVTPTFITSTILATESTNIHHIHNLSNIIRSLFSASQQTGKENTFSYRLLISWQMLGHPLCTNFAITKHFVDYVMHVLSLIDSSKKLLRMVIQRFCCINSSTTKIVALSVTKSSCLGRGQSLMFKRPTS